MRKKLLELLRERVAEGVTGPSTLRGRGREGFLKETRIFLKQLPLSEYAGTTSEDQFMAILDNHTNELHSEFRKIKSKNVGKCGKNEEWGAARKVLNLFLRDVLYNRYLCQHYHFQAIENSLEIPLDSYVVKGLRDCEPELPPWAGLDDLTQKDSGDYQDKAASIASNCGLARVHLDILLWRELEKPCGLCKQRKICTRSNR